jgi:hypothetical protein
MFDPSHPAVYNHGMSDLMDSVCALWGTPSECE